VQTLTPVTSYTGPTYFVRSLKDPNYLYEVAVDRGFLRCSCPAAIYRPSRPCRHIRSVVNGEALVAKPKAQPATHTGDLVMEGLNLPDEGMPRPARREISEAISVGMDF
jgi:hypothetical protein